jgi:glucose/arabinose dehydrogenase
LEEIDLVERGKNYGWNIMEGTVCYNPSSGCNQTGLELPVWNYTHDSGNNAIIGGYVYHGSSMPSLVGAYIYGDYGSGGIWALRYNGVTATSNLLAETNLNIASFGVDNQGELYFTAFNGKIYRLTAGAVPEYSAPALPLFVILIGTVVVLAGVAIRRTRGK